MWAAVAADHVADLATDLTVMKIPVLSLDFFRKGRIDGFFSACRWGGGRPIGTGSCVGIHLVSGHAGGVRIVRIGPVTPRAKAVRILIDTSDAEATRVNGAPRIKGSAVANYLHGAIRGSAAAAIHLDRAGLVEFRF